jgi:hypothetical protein
MPNTTNFNWATPADTDLVKDGAAAIRTLGSSIDTSLVDLKGGTTGQILSKATNTDLDYTWINNDQGDITEVQAGTGISVASGTGPIPVVTNSMATEITAKGDLIVGTGSGTFDNLPAGTNGFTLVADSVETTGLKWVAPSTSKTWTLLNAGGTALSGSATTTISGISDISDIFIVITGATSATGASEFFLRINGDTGGNYNFWYMNNQALAAYDDNIIFQGGSLTSARALLAKPSGASDTINGTAYISNCNSTSYKLLQTNFGGNFNAGSSYQNRWGQGFYVGTSVVSSVSVTSESYDFDGGTIYVYGA